MIANRSLSSRAAGLVAALAALLALTSVAGAKDKTKQAAPEPAKTAVTTTKLEGGASAAVLANPMAGAQGQSTFSVDMVMSRDGETYTMKRTVDHGKTRMDMRTKDASFTQIVLDDEKGTTYMLMPEDKRAIKQSRAAAEKMAGGHLPKPGADPTQQPATTSKIEKVGRETIDGHAADKYRVTYEQGSGLMWIDAERQLPLRMEADGATVEFKNYDFGPQPAELFAPPKGYEITDMDEMMAKMPKSMGMGTAGMMAGGMAKGFAGSMAGGIGGQMGGTLGAALGGPIGSMIGQYVGQKIGQKIGTAAAGAVLPGK